MIGEFGMIVLGVMVALGADSYMDSRDEAERARASLSLLVEDLVSDSSRMQDIAYYPPAHDSVRAILWSTPSSAALPDDSVLVLLGRLFIMPDFAPSRTTYESLVASDGIRYLGDAAFRAQLVRYYQEHQVDVAQWYDWWSREYIVMADLLREVQTPGPADFDEAMRRWTRVPQRLTKSWREIRSDDILMSQLWQVDTYEQNLAARISDALESNAALVEQVRTLAGR